MNVARVVGALALACCGAAAVIAQEAAPQKAQEATPQKVDIVSVTGCLKEQGAGNWMVVNATDPVPSIANAPQKKDLPTAPVAGKNQFKLIGVSEFNLPSHKDHLVVVKGLQIKATPVSRINVTSVTTVFDTCAGGTTSK